MKKLLKTRKFYMLSAILLSIVGVIVFFISNALSNKGSIEFKAYTGYYESDQHPITDIVNSEDGKPYYSIKNFYDNFDTWSKDSTGNVTANPTNFNSTEYIGIDDMTDLVAFSRLCNPDFNSSSYTSFLGYKYILTNNITTTSSSLYFMPIGTDSEHPFSGEFNGNGYDITNMSFVNIQNTGDTDHFKDNYPNTQEKIQYFAMFSNNSGTICNFGIINANLSFNYSSNGQFYKVAMICGENQAGGTINKVYVRDLRDADNKRAGIMPFGGYTISGLVFSNKGTVSNSYVAYSTVVNGAVDDFSDFSELIYENSGTESNLFFYNEAITKIGTSETYEGAQSFDKSSVEIVYSSLGMQVKRTVYGTYCQKLEYLDIAINATNTPDKIWYVPSNYGTAEDDVKTLVVTPMLRGLEFNNNTFSIKSIRDYAFMYELFNSNAALNNGKYTYQIESNINLEYLSADRYKYKGGIAANITGKTGTYTGVTINGSANSTYPTIYCPNFKDTFVTVEGFNAFGLFPYLTGSVSNLNIVASKKVNNSFENTPVNITVGNNNTATFGIISGYVDIGTIDNVNVFGNITIAGTEKAFIGGAVGVLTGNSTASNITTSGTLNSNLTGFSANQGNYLNGNVIGGVVGYTDFALANVYTLLNSMNINTNGVSNSVDLVVGGVVGAGYTAICNNLQNEGTITIGTNSADAVYNSLYVAGVFGRHLGQTEQVNGLTNYGNITVYNNISKDTYVCGSVNATPITKNVANLEVNNYKSNGKYYYRATKIINGANITINKTSANNHYTDVINVITDECVTRLSGVYNLAYSKNRGAANTTALGAKSISMNKFSTYSPVLNYEHSGDYDEAIISTVYNLRDINYTMASAISANVTYTGVINGTKVSMIDVRNEGNLTFTIDKALTGNLNIFGIIEEISANATASSLYNGGDIKVTYTAQITGNVNISGICYKNNNTSLNTLINNYNPNLDTFDANALGAMDSTINAGNIELTNPNYETGITYTPGLYASANNQQLIAFKYNPTYEGSYIKGNINVSGITNINYSIITNTFNIGDMFVANVCKDNGYKINVAGLVDLNIGEYAYILNSGNNGDIKAINLYNSSIKTDLTVAGIIARNDLTDSLANYNSNNGHSKQIVAFTINYGSIYAYNYNANVEGSNQEPTCKASGIIGMGLLNVVNVLNYGNIFGSETISGIFGVVYFARFKDEVSSSNKVKIANTINYGNTFILYKGYNAGDRATQAIANGSYDHNIITYSMFKEFDLNYDTFEYTGTRYYPSAIKGSGSAYAGAKINSEEISGTQNRIDYANYSISREVSHKSINGSIFSIINFDNNSNSQYVTIRYLINFEDSSPIVGYEPATPSNVTIDRSTIYSAYSHLDTRNNGSGQMVRDTYMAYDNTKQGTTGNNYVIYSPLTDETDGTIKTLLTNSTVDVFDSSELEYGVLHYNGVFSKSFDFYKAITKQYTKAEITANPTDAFLSDFFQFVEYSYINEMLVDKIGWKNIAYSSAANGFARSTANLNTLLTKLSSDNINYSSYTTYALNNTSIWTKWSTNEILIEVVNKLIENNNTQDLESMLEYIFSSNSKSNVLITKSMRQDIYEIISKNVSSDVLNNILSQVITYENGYSKELADAILKGNNEIETFISNYLKELDLDTTKNILQNYITILEDDTTSYFDYSSNETRRYDILDTMFKNINSSYFYESLCNYLNISSDSLQVDDKLKMIEGYESLSQNDLKKYELLLNILDNNDYTKISNNLSDIDNNIDFYSKLSSLGYTTSSMQQTYNNIKITDVSTTDQSVISERVQLWNTVKNTSTFQTYLKTLMPNEKYYFKATEHSNTYQSFTAPSNSGSFDGDLSYFYTASITPSTYFYGPYKSASADGVTGNLFDSKTIISTEFMTYEDLSPSEWHSVFISDSLKYVDSYDYYDFNTNQYTKYTNQTSGFENEIGTERIKGVLSPSLYMYEYGYTGANNQFASVPILKTEYYQENKTDFDGNTTATITDFGGTTFKTTTAYITFNGNTIPLSNSSISYHVDKSRDSGKFQIIDANGNQYTINCDTNGDGTVDQYFILHDDEIVANSSKALNLTYLNSNYYTLSTANHTITYKNSGDRTWADLIYRYGRNYYFSEVDSSYHSTKYTGIYQRTGAGMTNYTIDAGYSNKNASVVWFTHKKTQNNPVITTQYMDYTFDKLLELDGYYTNFSDGTTQCNDERNIINTIFNKYLCTSTNRANFQKVLRKALMEIVAYENTEFNNVVVKNWVDQYVLSDGYLRNKHSFVAYAEDGTRLYEADSCMGSNSNISLSISFWRYYYIQNINWFRADYTYTISSNQITFNNYGNVNTNDLTFTITGYRNLVDDTYNDYDGESNSISISSINYSNGLLTLKFRSNTQYHEYQRFDDVTLYFNILTIGTGANKKVTSIVLMDKKVEADNNRWGGVTDITGQWISQTPANNKNRYEITSNSLKCYMVYKRGYYAANQWRDGYFYYTISLSNITFNEKGEITNCNYSIDSCTRYYLNNQLVTANITYNNTNFPQANRKLTINNDRIVNLNYRLKVSNDTYDDVILSFVLVPSKNGVKTVTAYANDPYTISNNDIKNGTSTIATFTQSNNQFTNISYNNLDYYYKNLTYSDDNRTVSFDYIAKEKFDVDFVDQYINANINSDSNYALNYLTYSGSTTVKSYLMGLAEIQTTGYKSLLILNAIKNESTYYKLIKKLLELNVLTNQEMTEALGATVTGATASNAYLNIDNINDLSSNSIEYDSIEYYSSNKYGITATSITLSEYTNLDMVIIAKATGANGIMNVTSNCSSNDYNITSNMKYLPSNNNVLAYSGTVSNSGTYLYVIPKEYLYDYEELTVNRLDTEYYTYDSNTKTYTSVGTLFPSGTDYYRYIEDTDNPGTWIYRKTADISNANYFTNPYQFYKRVYVEGVATYQPVNDITKTYYRKIESLTPSITISMPNNNVVIYDIIQDDGNTGQILTKEVVVENVIYMYDNASPNTKTVDGTFKTWDSIYDEITSDTIYTDAQSTYTFEYLSSLIQGNVQVIPSSYKYKTNVTVDAQFAIYDHWTSIKNASVITTKNYNSDIKTNYVGVGKADYIFTPVTVTTSSEFSTDRDKLYVINDVQNGDTLYSQTNLNTNNIKGKIAGESEYTYFKKVDFASINNNDNNITIDRSATWNSQQQYYTIDYNLDSQLVGFYGHFNNDALDSTLNYTYIDTSTKNNGLVINLATKQVGDISANNMAILVAAHYNLQKSIGFGKSEVTNGGNNDNSALNTFYGKINSSYAILGKNSLMVLDPKYGATGGKDRSIGKKMNNVTYIDSEEKYITYVRDTVNGLGYSNANNPIYGVDSSSIYDTGSDRVVRMIDSSSFDDFSVNIGNSQFSMNYTSDATYSETNLLGQHWYSCGMNSTSGLFASGKDPVNVVTYTAGCDVKKVMYKVTYTTTYSVDYYYNAYINFDYAASDGNKYLSSQFYGTNKSVSTDNHAQDFRDTLENLLPLCTNDYAYIKASTEELNNNFDSANLYEKSTSNGNTVYTKTTDSSYDNTKTYYKVNDIYIYEIKNRLLKYLSDNSSGDYTITNFYKLLVCSSNESFINFINALYQANPTNLKTIYTLILEYMISKDGGYNFVADYIDKYHTLKTNTDTFITAAYLASDYENLYQQSIVSNNTALIADSKLKALLEAVNVTYEGTSIQYINNDGTFDNDKFDALLKYIGLGGNNDVYGIYALSSSKGIKNGDFIPDNLNLESHNAYYKKSKYTLGTNDVYVLELLPETSLDYADWRKQGNVLATKYGDKYKTGDNATTYSDSVNYAFLIEMKQLQKSIATTLFELDLNTSVATSQLSDYTMYSSQSLINEITKASDAKEKNHYAITYYVPSVYLEDIITNHKQLEIVELIKSSSATVYTDTEKTQEAKIRTESIAGTKFSGFVPATSLSSNTNYRSLDGCYVLENAIIIRAEDERVYSYYDILLRPMDFSFDMQYQQIQGVTKYDTFSTTSATVASTDGVISLNLTSPVIYVNTTDTTAKPGAVYYTRTGTEGNYVYKKADLTVGETIDHSDYYSTFTKAVEAEFRSGITYYIKTPDKNDNNKYVYTEADLTNHVITDNTYYIASEATKLPTGFDLAPYVKIRKQGSGGASIPNSFTLLNEAGNHVVKADGSADITLEILDTLEAGNYDVVVDLYGAEVKLPLTKLPNPNNDFTAVYDGKDLAFNKDGDNYVATTEILWGQPFAKYALLDLSYLDSFTKSPNSTVEVTTEYNVTGVTGTGVNYDIATYIVKIDVTSESEDIKHYQHKLVEIDPFRTENESTHQLIANDLYATLYEDGVVIGNAKLGEDITDSDKWTVKDNIMNVSFSRDKGEPNYRAKYSYKNIYYSLNNNVYSYEEYDTAGNIINTESSVKILYAGFNVVVTSACDTGTYTFGYVMNNPTYQDIDYYEYDEENNNYFITADILAIKDKDYYTYNLETDEYSKATLAENAELAKSRKLVFPKLRIEKTPSLNALVESATFIDGYEALGALATLVYPDYSIVPSNQVKAYNSNEQIYSKLIDGTQRISVDPTDRHITYEYTVNDTTNNTTTTTNYATATNDYYIVGTTSDASLDRYAPTITLQDDYAKLFRFVSPYRNNNYNGKQEATDYSILNYHDDDQIYLYVPFEIDGEEDVLMVKVNLKDMSYEEVWDTTLTKCYARYNNGSGSLKKDGENPTPYKGKELYDITFLYDDQTYKVSHYAGSVSANNSSLFDSYAEECENSRFWYVSYVVFSEDFFMNGLGKEPSAETTTTADWGNRIKYYNVAIIDISNNIRFVLEVDAPEGFMTETGLESIYTTFAYNKYSSTILTDTKQLSAYVEYKNKLYVKNGDDYVLTTGALNGSTQYYFYDQTTKGYIPVEWSTKGTVYDTYVSNYGIQLLPTAYYRFNLDLPSGYVATYKASKVNTYNPETSEISEDGSYLPPSSIVTQTIKITITIERGNVENTSSWGVSTSNVTTIVATEKTN